MFKNYRLIPIIALFLIICALFAVRLVSLQLVDGESFAEQSRNSVISRTVLPATRGDILDRYCRTIVSNKTAMTIGIDQSEADDLNHVIDKLIDIFSYCGEEYIDNAFPITRGEPYVYYDSFLEKDSSVAAFNKYLKSRKTKTDMSASDTLDSLIKYYKLSSYPRQRARDIIAVRYEMYVRGSGKSFVFADDVGIETVTMVSEADDLSCVYVSEEPVRVYSEEKFASHIIGYVGRIYAEEYEYLKSDGYSMNDYVGKEGIEKVMESYLRGKSGYKYTQSDVTGQIIGTIEDVSPVKGNDVILTLDREMQIVLEEDLEKVIYEIREQNGEDHAVSGAAVFMKINNGEILAMASWPTYNLSTYYSDYNTLSRDPGKPYVNRAISGTFAPGSTFKLVTAVAGLEEGIINKSSVYNCTGYYTYYESYQPSCFGYTAHGKVNVVNALKKSCNGFFFDVGRLLTIEKLTEYGKAFGFGQKTGIELSGESAGILGSKEYLASRGADWQAADTLLVAIGQSYTSATPIQLVNYIATVANGGTRYQPHIIKAVRDFETGEIVKETEITILEQLDLKSTTVEAVMEGIMDAASQTGGSAYSGFKDFDLVSVAVKTGTAENASGIPSALMIGVAPAENPEIAFAIVIENSGTSVTPISANVIKDVLSYYYLSNTGLDSVNSEGSLIP